MNLKTRATISQQGKVNVLIFEPNPHSSLSPQTPIACKTDAHFKVGVPSTLGIAPKDLHFMEYKSERYGITWRQLFLATSTTELQCSFGYKYQEPGELHFPHLDFTGAFEEFEHEPLKFRWEKAVISNAREELVKLGLYPLDQLKVNILGLIQYLHIPYLLHTMSTVGYWEGLDFLASELKIDLNTQWEPTGQTVLHVAILYDHKDVVEIALKYGVKEDTKNKWEKTAKDLATKYSHLQSSQRLINKKES